MTKQPKTKKTKASVREFLDTIDNVQRREDTRAVMRMMQKITRKRATMWGTSMIGFGSYHYKYASGHEGDWFVTGVSPRKQALTVYVMPGFSEYDDLLARLGKHKIGKSCLYVNKLEDVDMGILEHLITKSVRHMEKTYR